MARHNYVQVLAFVKKIPKSKDTIDGRTCIVPLVSVMGDREYHKVTSGYELSTISFCIKSSEADKVAIMESLEVLDVVRVTGFIATREVNKKSRCPNCDSVNFRTEACVSHGPDKVKSGGNEVYIKPITIKPIDHCETEQEAYEYLHKNSEDANRAFLIGNLTSTPVHGELQGGRKPFTRFQVAINRKYCPKGGSEYYERTDYPWIYSYGDKSLQDYQVLEKGDLVYVDGALQARKYKEQYVCSNCGTEYDVRGRTLEILSYDTEYLRLNNQDNIDMMLQE